MSSSPKPEKETMQIKLRRRIPVGSSQGLHKALMPSSRPIAFAHRRHSPNPFPNPTLIQAPILRPCPRRARQNRVRVLRMIVHFPKLFLLAGTEGSIDGHHWTALLESMLDVLELGQRSNPRYSSSSLKKQVTRHLR